MKIEEKRKAIVLRKTGYSLKEISKKLKVSKSVVSVWSRNIELSDSAKRRLLTVIKKGQYVAAEKKKAQTRVKNLLLQEDIKKILQKTLHRDFLKIICALIYWCEGSKDHGALMFTNSDANLTRMFIDLLERCFYIRRNKIVVLLHLHDYHNIKKQREFWAKKLDIGLKQFNKPYIKPSMHRRIREHYQGCASVRYYDTIIAKKLLFLAEAFIEKEGGIG